MWTLLAIAACLDEPVLVGVDEERAAVPETRAEQRAAYERAEGVVVDCGHLTGRPWEAVREEAARQLGDIVAIEELDGGKRRLELARGELSIVEGEVRRLRFELAPPLRRSQALAAAGIRPQVDRWYATHREWLLRWSAGFERVRLGKHADDPEMITWVECTRSSAGGGGR